MKNLSTYIDESFLLGSIIGATIAIGLTSLIKNTNLVDNIIDKELSGCDHPIRAAIQQCKDDIRIKRICKRLANDLDVLDYINKYDTTDQNKWEKFIISKLSYNEQRYIEQLTIDKVMEQ